MSTIATLTSNETGADSLIDINNNFSALNTDKVESASPTFTGTVIAPTIAGGTGTTSDLTLKTTTGVGASGADMHFQVGNNGGTEVVTILNAGNIGIMNTLPTNFDVTFAADTGNKVALYPVGANGGYGFGISAALLAIHSDTSSTRTGIGFGSVDAGFTEVLTVKGNLVGIKNNSPVETLTIGTAGTTAGTLSLAGATSGKAVIAVAAAAGTPTLTLPTTTGTLSTLGYTIQGNFSAGSPLDATTYYFGSMPSSFLSTTEGLHKIFIPKAGVIKAAYIFITNTGVLGTSETATFAIRLNATTDTTISSAVTIDATNQSFSNTGLSISVAQGDSIEIKVTTPTYVTNPTNVRGAVTLYIE